MFDDSFGDEDTNEVIYNRTVSPLVAGVFTGGKATCFAYGQTGNLLFVYNMTYHYLVGSGKTFTMMGSNDGSQNIGLFCLIGVV